MTINATIVAHSRPSWAHTRGDAGLEEHDICTLQLRYPRFIHSEFMTHRMFSRNASSSRAIPVERQMAHIELDPAIPTRWGGKAKGMQDDGVLGPLASYRAQQAWLGGMHGAVAATAALGQWGVHKQVANRVLEPWSHISVVVTATEWANFFKLRLNSPEWPEIQELATKMRDAMEASYPEILEPGVWHMPYVMNDELRTSVAGCARVSYLNHDSTTRTVKRDIRLYDKLLELGHMSPFEHQATPMQDFRGYSDGNYARMRRLINPGVTHVDQGGDPWSGNFKGWIQYRQTVV